MTFPDFMFREENKIPASQQNTPDIEGDYSGRSAHAPKRVQRMEIAV